MILINLILLKKMNLDLFIIIYLIVGVLLSILISFLFFRQYLPKEPKKIKKSKAYYFAYLFNIGFFALNINHIFITSLDFSISAFEKIPGFESYALKKIFDSLPGYYLLLHWLSKFLDKFGKFFCFCYTSGYFYICDIILDALTRYIYLEKQTCDKIYKYFKWAILGVIVLTVLLIVNINFNFVSMEDLKDGYNFIIFLSNFSNFLESIMLLFYIGFVVQNLFQLFLIEFNENEKENYNIWKLGKVYFYYNQEKEEIKEDIEKIEAKYKSAFPEAESKDINSNLNNIKENKDFTTFKHYYIKFIKEFKDSYSDYKYIDCKIEDIKTAVTKFRKEIYTQFKEDNNNEEENKKLFHISPEQENNIEYEYQFLKQYKKKIEFQNKKCCNCLFICCCCCLCCKCVKNKNPKKVIINEICYMISKINEKLVSFKRKFNLIEEIKDDILNARNNNCCKKFKYLIFFIITIIILSVCEIPLFYFDNLNIYKEEYNISNEFAFIFILCLFIFLISFYFIIFTYAHFENEYIHGEGLYGKNKSVLDPVNFFNFTQTLDFFSVVIYHASWVLNKKGTIKAKFNEVFYLPDYDFNENLNLLSIFPFISLGLILIFIFISSKFSKISICGFILFNINENSGFFDDNEKFYGYFFIGCGCYIDIFKRLGQRIDLSTENQSENYPDYEIKLLDITN